MCAFEYLERLERCTMITYTKRWAVNLCLTGIITIMLFDVVGCTVYLTDVSETPAPRNPERRYKVVLNVERGAYVTSVDKPRVNIDGIWHTLQSTGTGNWEYEKQLPS